MFTFWEKFTSCFMAATIIQLPVSIFANAKAPTTPMMASAMMPHGIVGQGEQSSL